MSLGIIAAFSSSITWAIGVTQYSKLARSHNPATINFSRAALSFPVFFTVSVFTEATSWAYLQWSHLFWLTISIVSSYAFGDTLFLFSTVHLGVPASLAISSTYILWSAFAGVVFRGEFLNGIQWSGVLLILIGTVFVILSGYRFKQTPSRTYWKGVFLALGTSILWALNTFGVAKGSEHIPATTVNTIRMLLAMILCVLFGRLMNQRLDWTLAIRTLRIKNFKNYGWAILLESVLGSFLFTYGLSHASLSVASTLSSLAPVISVPLSWILKTEAIQFQKALGVILVTVGITLLLNY